MAYYKNWRCGSYRFSHDKRKDFSYQELKECFFIDGSEVIYCKKDFGACKAGRYYLISDGEWCGCGFIVHDWEIVINGNVMDSGFDSWTGKEYMKGPQAPD